jgi:hypothetical protein
MYSMVRTHISYRGRGGLAKFVTYNIELQISPYPPLHNIVFLRHSRRSERTLIRLAPSQFRWQPSSSLRTTSTYQLVYYNGISSLIAFRHTWCGEIGRDIYKLFILFFMVGLSYKVRTKHGKSLYTVEVLYPHLMHNKEAVSCIR